MQGKRNFRSLSYLSIFLYTFFSQIFNLIYPWIIHHSLRCLLRSEKEKKKKKNAHILIRILKYKPFEIYIYGQFIHNIYYDPVSTLSLSNFFFFFNWFIYYLNLRWDTWIIVLNRKIRLRNSNLSNLFKDIDSHQNRIFPIFFLF